MRIIAVAGMPGAGKEEFLTVARGMGIPFLRMGDVVRDFHAERAPEDAALSVGQIANTERERHGYSIWAKRAMARMHGAIFLVDGCRSMDEVRAYRELTDDVMVVGIHSSPATRYERLVRRNRDDAPRNPEEFMERDRREIGWGLAELIVLSDVLIVNEGTLSDFRTNSEIVLRKMMK